MWDSKNVVRDQDLLQVTYNFTVPLVDHSEEASTVSSIKSDITEPNYRNVLKPWKTTVLSKYFETEQDDAFDRIVRDIRSSNKNIAKKFGFKLKGSSSSSSGESVVEPEEIVEKVIVEPEERVASSDHQWNTVTESSSFASTQWECSRTDLRAV